jgi:hypothetical protein
MAVVLLKRVDPCGQSCAVPVPGRRAWGRGQKETPPRRPNGGEHGNGIVPVPGHRRSGGTLRQSSPASARRALAWPRDLRQTRRLLPSPTNHLLANCSRLLCPNGAATIRGGTCLRDLIYGRAAGREGWACLPLSPKPAGEAQTKQTMRDHGSRAAQPQHLHERTKSAWRCLSCI